MRFATTYTTVVVRMIKVKVTSGSLMNNAPSRRHIFSCERDTISMATYGVKEERVW